MKILLKNVSDKPFTFEFTDHPMSNASEFAYMPDDTVLTEKGLTQVETLDRAIRKSPRVKDKLSTHHKLAIEVGQTVIFGDGEKYNLEQAEYIYGLFGGYAEQYQGGPEVVPPIIEVDEEGEEKKDNLYLRHRARKPRVTNPEGKIEQFQMPEKK